MRSDTIVAVATPPGEGGIGIVRLSGGDAAAIAARVFRGRLRDRRAVFGHVHDPRNGDVIDEALALLLRAPRTYTREETVEFQAHGSPFVLQRIVELCLREGARLGEPGEFTLRAFLNGRLDLAQAESVLDVIQSRTDASLRLALQGLGGRLGGRLRPLRARLLDLLAYLSARADFPDEDVPADDIAPALRQIVADTEAILATAAYGIVYREGLRIAIVGRPNVGKSSLLNRLLGEERAIVTPIAGTTRDTVEETANLGGVPVILIDTAGLNETEDLVEQIGVSRARAAMARSDALLVVLDCGRAIQADERELLELASARPSVIAINKSDLRSPDPQKQAGADVSIAPRESNANDARTAATTDGVSCPSTPLRGEPDPVYVSALTGAGLGALSARLSELVTRGRATAADTPVVTNPRHAAALERMLAASNAALDGLEAGLPEDLVSVDLRTAVNALGEITGERVTEDLLDSIFRNFCIGK